MFLCFVRINKKETPVITFSSLSIYQNLKQATLPKNFTTFTLPNPPPKPKQNSHPNIKATSHLSRHNSPPCLLSPTIFKSNVLIKIFRQLEMRMQTFTFSTPESVSRVFHLPFQAYQFSPQLYEHQSPLFSLVFQIHQFEQQT